MKTRSPAVEKGIIVRVSQLLNVCQEEEAATRVSWYSHFCDSLKEMK